MQNLDILAIGVHPDDIELGCAGTLIKHVKQGDSVGILDLTAGELGTRGTPDLRIQEANNAAKIMGIDIRENLGMSDGFFQNDKAHQLKLIEYIRKYRPNIIIANALEDRHPDHGRAGRLIADACFLSGLRKVETIHNSKSQKAWRPKRIFHYMQDRSFTPNFIVDVSDVFNIKMDSILAYKSQFHDSKSSEPITYIATDSFLNNIKGRHALLGKQIGATYGEGFMCENVIGVDNLSKLQLPEIS